MKKVTLVVICILSFCINSLYGQEDVKKQEADEQKRLRIEMELEYAMKIQALKKQQIQLQIKLQQNENFEEAFRQKAMMMQLQEKQIQYEQALAVYAEFGEKTEQPTDRRRQEAREKGNVARSNDLNAAGLMLAAACAGPLAAL